MLLICVMMIAMFYSPVFYKNFTSDGVVPFRSNGTVAHASQSEA